MLSEPSHRPTTVLDKERAMSTPDPEPTTTPAHLGAAGTALWRDAHDGW